MNNRVNVAGIYNLDILKSAVSAGVEDFTFDLRPTSFNFIQEYILLELLEFINLRDKTIYLHFEGEADFVIQKILKDVRQVMAGLGKIQLLFSDLNSLEYYEQFQTPFHLVVKDNGIEPKINDSAFLAGLVFPLETVEQFGLSKCLKIMGAAKNVNGERVISSEVRYDSSRIVDTHNDIPSDQLFFTIGSHLEVGYRQVDSLRIKNHLNHLVKT